MMKRAILILTVAMMLTLIVGIGAASAYSISGNIHGSYASDTNACGQCHSTHAAAGQNLIQALETGTQNDVYRTCIYCHKSGGQSKYDSVNGAVETGSATYASSAGGFTQVVTTEGATPAYTAVVSKHNVAETSGTAVWVPGYDSAVGSHMELTCASCHDPHNTAGTARALRVNMLSADISATPPVLDITALNVLANEDITYQGGWNQYCGACHKDFLQTAAGSGDADSGTYSTKKRHRVGMDPSLYTGTASGSWTIASLSQPSTVMPLQSSDGTAPNQQVSCLTCHYAHGTKATNTVTFSRTDGTTSSSSALLRLNNRGVCEACHNK